MNGHARSPSPPGATRSIDIEIGTQEIITIELDNLDPNPSDIMDLLKEGQCKVWVWTRLASEYWRRGYLDAAERIGQAAVESFSNNGATASLPPVYSLLANIQIARARNAPKVILPNARQDDMSKEKPKEDYYREAAQMLNSSERAVTESGEGFDPTLAFLTRGIQQLATRSLDDALRTFEGVLVQKPTNVVALLGKARILYARRQFPQALKLFQQVLQLNPRCLPDPRIGIGLCLWAMNHQEKARAAWQRSVDLYPDGWAAQLLLGLEAVNTSKDESKEVTERTQALVMGSKLIETAFRANNRGAAAANALCELLLMKGNYARALKLSERAIQFADTLSILTEGYIRAGRVCHAESSYLEAGRHYSAANEGNPKHVLAAIGQAQMSMLNDEWPAAIHALDTLIQPPNPQKSLEATAILASIRSHQRPGVSSSDMAKEKASARELFDRVAKELHLYEDQLAVNGHANQALPRSLRDIKDDMDMHAEVARLWQEDNLDRTARALHEALRISESTGQVDPRLLNNLGSLHHLDGRLQEARLAYERALTSAAGLAPDVGEGMSTSILYNLARAYEDEGDEQLAKDAYEKLLTRHPEYVDAKIRQAHMLVEMNRQNEAHDLLKQALSSQSSNMNLRAYYTHFLINSAALKVTKEFVFATLKDHDKHDLYSLCAAGWIQYNQARESREQGSQAVQDRKLGFRRAAEFYEKALQLDSSCAFAAQGLAIVTAEDALGFLAGGVPHGSSSEEAQRRFKNARDALDIFAKVRESINDGSVYVNIGHCHYVRDEFDRAIESYESANKRFYDGHNVTVLMCLCRSWYAKSIKDQSFQAMNTALRYAQQALHLQPNDKVTLYNIAMIQQKAAEMMFALPTTKRSLQELERAIEHAGHAQQLFASLASDPSPQVPYSKDIADQRKKYGDSMLRRADEQLGHQTQHEAETQARLNAARQKRQEDRERQEQLEVIQMERLRIQAEELAEERRKAREQALEWSRQVKDLSDEEDMERPRKQRKTKKQKGGDISGDEAAAGSANEGKRKRRARVKRDNNGVAPELPAADEEEALFSEDEGEKTAKRRGTKKRVVRDDDEEDPDGGPGPARKKQIKSKEYINDSDEEMDD
ncbi:RNA polymerase II-associated protein [Heliocybe sulcata]|uniref:RNA polymerase II-associated protein n=1 Tax=Heliocybe sulcata TaxID=5364 RepID=A0A5C3NB96_9AGAM|nr:RNA polymerase II-associated protein [Heliocybe sulcata]